MANTITTKRGVVRNMLNNGDKAYRLSTYAKRAGRAVGREVSKSEVRSCLRNLCREGKIQYFLSGERVIGWDRAEE